MRSRKIPWKDAWAAFDSRSEGMTSEETFLALCECACDAKHPATIDYWLSAGNETDIDGRGKNGETALMVVAKKNYPEVVNTLLDRGADINAKDDKGWTALMYAAEGGHLKAVRALLQAGADINARDIIDDTALTLAAGEGHEDTALELLEAGANIEAENEDGITALYIAAREGLIKLLKALLKAGVNKETHSRYIDSALWCAALHGKSKAVKALIRAGAHVNAQYDIDDYIEYNYDMGSYHIGDNALMLSVSSHDMENYDNDSVVALLKAGSSYWVENKSGQNALMLAVKNGNLQAVETLLNAGASPKTSDNIGETALIYAAREGSPEIATALLKAGADTEVLSKCGRRTALIEAAIYKKPEVITVLLKAGAKPRARNRKGRTAFQYAARFGTPETVAAFLDQGVYNTKVVGVIGYDTPAIDLARRNSKLQGSDVLRRLRISSTENYAKNQTRYGWTSLMRTIMADQYDHEAVTAMLNSGINIEERNDNGDTALIIASRYGRLEAVKALFEGGADPEAKNKDGYRAGRTALMEAVTADEYNRKVIASLVSSGANLETKDRNGHTALFHAVDKNKLKAVFALLRAGANIEARANDEETALIFAVRLDCLKAATALLKAGANVDAKDKNGNTAITIIEERVEDRAKRNDQDESADKRDVEMLRLLREARLKNNTEERA